MSRIHRIRPNAPEMPSFYKQTEKFIKNFSTKFSVSLKFHLVNHYIFESCLINVTKYYT